MDSIQLGLFKQALIEACDKHLAIGGTIQSMLFGGGVCRCPIACLVVNSGKGYRLPLCERMGFEISEDDFWNFLDGFDDSGIVHNDSEMYQLGVELRAKYLSETVKESSK
jgi:hypothetical protein